MSLLWMGLIALGVLSTVIVHRFSVRLPRCPSCRIAADPVSEGLLNSWPTVIGVAHRCPRCGHVIWRHFVGDVTA
jgi:predicted RNA-binding Zn-ribbon protein involved in translation (DUF1610 family)